MPPRAGGPEKRGMDDREYGAFVKRDVLKIPVDLIKRLTFAYDGRSNFLETQRAKW